MFSSPILGAVNSDNTADGGQSVQQQVSPAPSAQAAPTQTPAKAPAQGGSRLAAIIGAVANVASTALSGIPNQGRPSFVNGLGNGARAEQANIANQQAIKFKTFDDQVRIAALHHQDQELQLRTQEQQDAHQKFQDFQDDYDEEHGIVKNTIPNHGGAVTDHLTAQTAANGAASVPAGTYLSADGNSIHVPVDSPETDAGMLKKYNTFAPVYGLPALPRGAQFVPPKYQDYLTHVMQGYAINGTPVNHDDLTTRIATLQTQRDQLAKSGKATPDQLTALDNTVGILQANQKALDAHQQTVLDQASQRKTDSQVQVAQEKGDQIRQTNAAKPQKPAAPQSIVGFDPQTNERVVVNADDPKASTLGQSGKVSSQQLDNWGTAQNQFANVQLAVSRYDQAARNFAQSGKPSDTVGINSALNKTGIGDVQIGEWGIRIPGFSSVAEAASRVANSAAFRGLSPAGQDLVDKYFRMMSSIPEYQKASTGIGRTNKEMLDLELKNIPDPTMSPSTISNRLGSFQEALSSNASRVPRIQGVPHYKDVQQRYQQQTQPPSRGSVLGQTMGNATDIINRLVPNQ